ncbi:hypothetical protein ACO0LB_20490, partial [Undibacterium sp. SXout7W]
GNYAQAQYEKALANTDKEGIEQWKEGGTSRVLLHTLVGALTGGTSGAAGAASSQILIPDINEQIKKLDIPDTLKSTLVQLAGISIGALTGGTAGAVASENATANNLLIHDQQMELARLKSKCASTQGCSPTEESRIQELLTLAKKPYYSGTAGQYTFNPTEAEQAYTGMTAEQLSAQRTTEQDNINAQLKKQSQIAKDEIWTRFQQYAQDMQGIESQTAQETQTQKNKTGTGAVIGGATTAITELVTSLAELPQTARTVKQ